MVGKRTEIYLLVRHCIAHVYGLLTLVTITTKIMFIRFASNCQEVIFVYHRLRVELVGSPVTAENCKQSKDVLIVVEI